MNVKIRWLFIATICLSLFVNNLQPDVKAQAEIPGPVTLQSSSIEGVTFEVLVPWELISLKTIEEEGQTFSSVHLPGWDRLNTPGAPQLPYLTQTIGVPFGVDISVNVIPGISHVVDLSNPIIPEPTQKMTISLSETTVGEPIYSFEYEKYPEFYESSTPFPDRLAEITNDGVSRNQRIAGISVHPIQYNPLNQSLTIYESLVISIHFTGTAKVSLQTNLEESMDYEDFYRTLLLNYQEAAEWRSNLPFVVDNPSEDVNLSNISEDTIGRWSPPDDAYKVLVKKDGFFKLTYVELQLAGLPVDTIDPRTFQLYSRGEEIAIKVEGEEDTFFNPEDAIIFYGEAVQNKYSDENVYWLTFGHQVGKRSVIRDGTPGIGDTPLYYESQNHLEENHYYRSVLPGADDFERFYWASLYATSSNPLSWSKQFQVMSPHTGVANLKAAIFGSLDHSLNPDHHMIIRVNSVDVAEAEWDGLTWHQVNEVFDASILVPGENTVELYLPNDTGVTIDLVLVDWIEISFPSEFAVDPAKGELVFSYDIPGTWRYPITGFTTDGLMLFDVSDPSNVVEFDPTSLSIEPDGPGYSLTFEDEIITRKDYWAASSSTIETILAKDIVERAPSNLQLPTNQADYLIISHNVFLSEAQRLADHRETPSGGNLEVMIIDVQDIYDEFGYGLVHPEAINEYLKYTLSEWAAPAPSYVVFVGDGHYDPKKYIATSPESYIPPYLAFTDPWDGETAADNRYVSLSEGDNLADMMLGRLAVNNTSEANAFIDKIIAYESKSTQEDWMTEVLAVAGEADSGGDFPLYSDELINDTLPEPYTAENISYGITHTTKETAQAALKAEISEGKFIVNFIGHGFSRGWSASKNSAINFIQTADVPSLSNAEKYPIILAMTCKEGAFHDPSTPSFGEVITKADNKGAIASWSPTGQGVSSGHDFMNRGFFEAVFKFGVVHLGEAMRQGQFKLWVTDSSRYLLDGYVLFGDPATMINRRSVASNDDYYTTEDEILEVVAEDGVLRNDFGLAPGNSLTASLVPDVSNGDLELSANGSFTYTPDQDWYGIDSYTYAVYDGATLIGTAEVTITVYSINDDPVANPQTLSTKMNTALAIVLTGTDADGDALTYAAQSGPSHGDLSGTAPNITYTPDTGYSGVDSFTFVVNDGKVDSNTATVTITVTAVNEAPVANGQSVSTAEDTAKPITLTGSDADSDPLTYNIVAPPTHGALSGSGPSVTYTPATNYNGPDSFTFKVNDGKVDSNTAMVSITVTPVNDAPVANSQSVSTAEDTAKPITLTGADADSDPLTYTIVAPPTHGALSGSGPNVTYTPDTGYSGMDSFTFIVNDGTVDSAPATVTIQISSAGYTCYLPLIIK